MASTGTIAPEAGINFADLIGRVADGDTHAFDTLYRASSGRVFSIVVQVLRDLAQSEEVTQEVFLQVWQLASQFDGSRGTGLAWMMTLAHRRAIDRVRAAQASRDRDLRIGVRDYSAALDSAAFDSVAETVEIRLADASVRSALERLTLVQRRAICLTYYDGMSATEAAQLIGIPVGTLRTRLRDGLIRLRDELAVTSVPA